MQLNHSELDIQNYYKSEFVMPFIRKLSFRKETPIECTEKPIAGSTQTDLPPIQKGDKAVLASLQELTAMSENNETVTAELLGTPVLQGAENKGDPRNNLIVGYSLSNGNENVEILEPPTSPSVNNIGSDPDDPDTSTTPPNNAPL